MLYIQLEKLLNSDEPTDSCANVEGFIKLVFAVFILC